eukprot:CAMPEP_0194212644 /NCGR_PEP_ID=MMETSP0156-20130528/12680_1 /TAXON_ID=33649 /ORGANISM="Thalassionema nitzschioides, Strain L26-B" /LENGTH=437 /DNA_ID=CAMNT_0038940515 /DNA_START=101 /DNA_END=1414 /DNA_ORIENTATION=-
MASDLHEAILANSLPIVQMLLARGADPNISPLIAPIGIIDKNALSSSNSNNSSSNNQAEKVRDLHRTLGRVFRSRKDGTIHPLHVAVCNLYHHCSVGKDNALQIVQELLHAPGVNVTAKCCGVAFCNIGTYPSVTVHSNKTAAKVVLFLKRFPPQQTQLSSDNNKKLKEENEHFESIMDHVAALIQEKEYLQKDKERASSSPADEQQADAVAVLWTAMLDDEASCSDFSFVCSDGSRVKAHKSVLKTASPYFRKENASTMQLNTSHSSSVINAIMEFIYLGRFEQDAWCANITTQDDQQEEQLTKLLSAATEFEIEPLIDRIVPCIISNYLNSLKSCKAALMISHEYELKHLKVACLEYIEENSTLFLVDPSFLGLSSEHPELWNEVKETLLFNNNNNNSSSSNKRRRLQLAADDNSSSSDCDGAILVLPEDEDHDA